MQAVPWKKGGIKNMHIFMKVGEKDSGGKVT